MLTAWFLINRSGCFGSLAIGDLSTVIGNASGFERAFTQALPATDEAVDVLASPFFNANRERLVQLASRYRLPAIYESREYAEAGGLVSYGQDLAALFSRAATYVDKILKGAKPSDLPWEQSKKFELVINLKAGKALDLSFPQAKYGALGAEN